MIVSIWIIICRYFYEVSTSWHVQFDIFASLFCVDVFLPSKACRHQVHQPRLRLRRVHRSPFCLRSIGIREKEDNSSFLLLRLLN